MLLEIATFQLILSSPNRN